MSEAVSGATASAATIPERPGVHYTAAQAARLSGCTAAQVRHWTETGLVGAGAPGPGYGFRELVTLRVVRSLFDAGLSSVRVRAAVDAIRGAGDDLASLRLVTDGRDVWVCRDDGQILDALRHGPLALFVGVDRVAAAVDAEVRAFTSERAAFVEQLVARS
ncbi:MAG TPA: MerR family transcriptional regulator [Acidimicrobiia bacterium]|nr:MerR family transcriptional regulator [Acidimicrobiia bacterium]